MNKYRGPITTALQFVASFRNARVLSSGCIGSLCWLDIMADEDGTEEQYFFVMEQRQRPRPPEYRDVELKVIPNLSATELEQAKLEPRKFWEHPRAHTPQHGDDSRW